MTLLPYWRLQEGLLAAAIACPFLIGLMGQSTQSPQSPQAIAKTAFDATVLLVMEDANGQPLSLGSGFFVAPNVVATNLHVINGSSSGYAKLVDHKRKYDIIGVAAIDQLHDLALLQLRDAEATALKVASSDDVEVGDSVFAVGNPRGLEGTFSQGIVSSVRILDDSSLLQVTAPISPGSSGGPVLNENGQVVGVAVATYLDGQNLNFAIPSKYVAQLVKRIGKPVTLSESVGSRAPNSLVDKLNGNTAGEVSGSHFAWTENPYMGYYTFSVRNNLREPIRDVRCLIIFYAEDGLPIETEYVTIPGPIGGKLAKRSPQKGRLEPDQVRSLTSSTEIRVLDFRLSQ